MEKIMQLLMTALFFSQADSMERGWALSPGSCDSEQSTVETVRSSEFADSDSDEDMISIRSGASTVPADYQMDLNSDRRSASGLFSPQPSPRSMYSRTSSPEEEGYRTPPGQIVPLRRVFRRGMRAVIDQENRSSRAEDLSLAEPPAIVRVSTSAVQEANTQVVLGLMHFYIETGMHEPLGALLGDPDNRPILQARMDELRTLAATTQYGEVAALLNEFIELYGPREEGS